jgi:hypothetical protein
MLCSILQRNTDLLDHFKIRVSSYYEEIQRFIHCTALYCAAQTKI